MTKGELIKMLEPFNDSDNVVITLTKQICKEESDRIAEKIKKMGNDKYSFAFVDTKTSPTDYPTQYTAAYDKNGHLEITGMGVDESAS